MIKFKHNVNELFYLRHEHCEQFQNISKNCKSRIEHSMNNYYCISKCNFIVLVL